MGAVYDALTGSTLMTEEDSFIDPDDFLRYISALDKDVDIIDLDERRKKHNVPQDSGKHLFSALLPRDLYYNHKGVVIQDGILIKGQIRKAHIGTVDKSLIQRIWKDFGVNETVQFMTDIYFLTGIYLKDRGFSIGIKDCIPKKKESRKLIEEEVAKAKLVVKQLGGELNDPVELERQQREISAALNTSKNVGDRISKEAFPDDNALRIMQLSGAKGKETNIAQIGGMLGQVFLRNGQRVPMTLGKGRRCLPMFEEGDLDPETRGFCVNSYLTGLTPPEIFFHSLASREGLITTAISTATVGYINHNAQKAMEDVTVYPDKSMRNFQEEIIQFLYAEDGFDAASLELVDTPRGKIAFFVDAEVLAGRLNNQNGYFLRDGEWIKL